MWSRLATAPRGTTATHLPSPPNAGRRDRRVWHKSHDPYHEFKFWSRQTPAAALSGAHPDDPTPQLQHKLRLEGRQRDDHTDSCVKREEQKCIKTDRINCTHATLKALQAVQARLEPLERCIGLLGRYLRNVFTLTLGKMARHPRPWWKTQLRNTEENHQRELRHWRRPPKGKTPEPIICGKI